MYRPSFFFPKNIQSCSTRTGRGFVVAVIVVLIPRHGALVVFRLFDTRPGFSGVQGVLAAIHGVSPQATTRPSVLICPWLPFVLCHLLCSRPSGTLIVAVYNGLDWCRIARQFSLLTRSSQLHVVFSPAIFLMQTNAYADNAFVSV